MSHFVPSPAYFMPLPMLFGMTPVGLCDRTHYMANCQDHHLNTLRPKQNGRHFADDIFKCIFLNENGWIPLKISLMFVRKGPINNIPTLVQVMAWRRPGDKPLSEPMMVSLSTHICVTRPQWVNTFTTKIHFLYKISTVDDDGLLFWIRTQVVIYWRILCLLQMPAV